jgi:hypothetical protein
MRRLYRRQRWNKKIATRNCRVGIIWVAACRSPLNESCLLTKKASKICSRMSQSQNRVSEPLTSNLGIRCFTDSSIASKRLLLSPLRLYTHFIVIVRPGSIAPATQRRVRAQKTCEVDWMIEQPLLDRQHCHTLSNPSCRT